MAQDVTLFHLLQDADDGSVVIMRTIEERLDRLEAVMTENRGRAADGRVDALLKGFVLVILGLASAVLGYGLGNLLR